VCDAYPRFGIANRGGTPHYFDCRPNVDGSYPEEFELWPTDPDSLEAELRNWDRIHTGTATRDSIHRYNQGIRDESFESENDALNAGPTACSRACGLGRPRLRILAAQSRLAECWRNVPAAATKVLEREGAGVHHR